MPIDDLMNDENQGEDEDDPDERRPRRLLDSRRQADGELSDSDDEDDGRRNHMSHRRRGRGRSSDSDSKLKYGINIGILASSSAPIHGAGPSGRTNAVRVLSSNVTGDEEASTETAEGDMYMDLDGTPPAQENGIEACAMNGAFYMTSTPSSPKEVKEQETGVDDMNPDNIPVAEPTPSQSSPTMTVPSVSSAHVSRLSTA